MTQYQGTARVEKIDWEAPEGHGNPHAVAVIIAIPAAQFTGLDITRPFTIIQEDEDEDDYD